MRARLLIVDDEIAQLKALCDTLGDQTYETVGVSSGQQALDALHTSGFDLLLADLSMPGMDGITLLREALELDPNLVGIIMTGEGTIKTAVEAMQTGALDYILKPFKLSQIIPVLSRALAVRQLRIDKAQLEHDLRERTADLEAANADLQAFSSSVSHDLRAPLRAIAGFTRILSDEYGGLLPAEGKELLGDVIDSAIRMDQLIADLLRFSRLGRATPVKDRFSMNDLAREVLADAIGQEGDRQIEVCVHELPDAVGDASLIRQVWTNLISNAIKFTRQAEPADVEIGHQADNGASVYFVRDNGAGFDMRHANRLFGVFERLHKAEQFEGSGVGLSIVHRIIQSHGGRIWAESAVGKGATFYFTLG